MKKQTAVEWLVEQLEEHHVKIDIKNTVVFHQAKAMEKEQIMDAIRYGFFILKSGEDVEQCYTSNYE
jgi:hypothetical protein